jgi:hypothetical protein
MAFCLVGTLAAPTLSCGEPSPVLTGRASQALASSGDIQLEIGQWGHRVAVESDGYFNTSIPTGDVEIRVEGRNIAGYFVLRDVQPTEWIEVEVKVSGDSIKVEILRREIRDPYEYHDHHHHGHHKKHHHHHHDDCYDDNPFGYCDDDDRDSDHNPFDG